MRSLGIGFIITGLLGIMLYSCFAGPPDRPGWQEVQTALNNGLPKTAIEQLDTILTDAKAAGRDAEWVRARTLQIVLDGDLQNEPLSKRIEAIKKEIESAKGPSRSMMQAILAQWYWSYYQQNRWQYMNRTAVASDAIGDDLTTWDLTRILSEIDQQFQTVLADAETLQAVPTTSFSELIDLGTNDAEFTPTLYDFSVRSALQFYQAGEQAVSSRVDAWVPKADGPILGTTDDFLAWKIDTDQTSPVVRATRLYQDWIRFRQANIEKEIDSLVVAELDRIEFASSEAVGQAKSQRVISALKELSKRFADHPSSTLVDFRLAEIIDAGETGDNGDRVAAREIAIVASKRHPDSIGAKRCLGLVSQIEAKECQFTTDSVWGEEGIRIAMSYRNVEKIYFRLIVNKGIDFQNSGKLIEQLLQAKPVRSWNNELPRTSDYKHRQETLDVTQDVALGKYVLLSSHDPDFNKNNNQIQWTPIVRSNLAMVTRSHPGSGLFEVIVTDGKSGQPISGADVRLTLKPYDASAQSTIKLVTNKDGIARHSRDQTIQFFHVGVDVKVTVGDDELSSENQSHIQQYRENDAGYEQTLFFTDRSIYRPGQTMYFKGVACSVNSKLAEYAAIADRNIEVALFDVNGQEVERLKLRSNRYGSIHGRFAAPREGLRGSMSIRVVDNGPTGQTAVQVEEYKRPKFKVELDTPKSAALEQPVSLEGSANSYNGFPIAGASAGYRVIRHTQYPRWCWWFPVTPPTEIASGTVTTDADGKFTITFLAVAPADTDASAGPTFRFEVTADVTDTTGETRSDSQSMTVGFQTVQANLNAAGFLTSEKPVEFSIRTESLDGKGKACIGEVEFFKVRQPDEPVLPPMQAHFDYPLEGIADAQANFDRPDPTTWPIGEMITSQKFETNPDGSAKINVALPAGPFRAILKTTDDNGREVLTQTDGLVIDVKSQKFPLKVGSRLVFDERSYQPGETANVYWCSGYENARALVEVVCDRETLQSYWTQPGQTQHAVAIPIKDSMRGGVTVRTTMIHKGQLFSEITVLSVPWDTQKLKIKLERFVSKLKPGGEEKLTLTIEGEDAKVAAAEVVATMYDASLDAFAKLSWIERFSFFRNEYANLQTGFQNSPVAGNTIWQDWPTYETHFPITHPSFPYEIVGGWMNTNSHLRMRRGMALGAPGMPNHAQLEFEGSTMGAMAGAEKMMAMQVSDNAADADNANFAAVAPAPAEPTDKADGAGQPDVPPRTNLNETAFFFPSVVSDEQGRVTIEFKMPEALTQWRMIAFAHDAGLRSGSVEASAVTSKDLMIEPNPPRFLRAGDEIEFTAKVSNSSTTGQNGTAFLSLRDPQSGDDLGKRFQLDAMPQRFELAAGRSQTFAWELTIPDGIDAVVYRVTANSDRASDGEEADLPVLPRKVLVTQSIQIPIRDLGEKTVKMSSLLDSEGSPTIDHRLLELQVVSNAAWYVVESLPTLIEYPHGCAEQTFNRLYAGIIANHLVQSDPKIGEVLKRWRAEGGAESLLLENADLRSVLIEETPWVRQAKTESESRRHLADLLDENQIRDSIRTSTARLAQMQNTEGGWPWFPGGQTNPYITLYIVTGFGRLRHVGIDVDMSLALRAVQSLDQDMENRYRLIKPEDRKNDHIDSTVALYLYGRSFFLKDMPINDAFGESWNYWVGQSKEHWLKSGSRQSQAHIAVALKRLGDADKAGAIVKSLLERSVNSEEMGLHWNDAASWWWYYAPIETQAMMIEAIDEVAGDLDAVEDAKVWLIKQKQTQSWPTTKSTADAIYAVLMRGRNPLASRSLVQATWGDQVVQPTKVEAGTGFYNKRVTGSDVQAKMGQVTLTKTEPGVAWAGLHWQYLEDIAKVPMTKGTPLKIEKRLFIKQLTPTGHELVPVDGPVKVGDELVVRLILRTDRDMEFIHLKDHRGSGTEPTDVISGYRFTDGLSYYHQTSDAASHFFIDRLPEGTYVLEYSTRIQLRGQYQTGFANIQCMYAPEFSAHSESHALSVQ
jgi:uncharacterized protein YfaS (alpha-2-macroglobulin family)